MFASQIADTLTADRRARLVADAERHRASRRPPPRGPRRAALAAAIAAFRTVRRPCGADPCPEAPATSPA